MNNFGLTIITTMEEEHLMVKTTFDKMTSRGLKVPQTDYDAA